MQKITAFVLAASLSCGSGVLLAQQPNPSQNSQDVPHQEPGTNNPDMGKQRQPSPNHAPGQNGGAQDTPTQNNPDVPHQEPGTDSPDLGKQRQPSPGNDTGTQPHSSKSKGKRKKQNSTASQTSQP